MSDEGTVFALRCKYLGHSIQSLSDKLSNLHWNRNKCGSKYPHWANKFDFYCYALTRLSLPYIHSLKYRCL